MLVESRKETRASVLGDYGLGDRQVFQVEVVAEPGGRRWIKLWTVGRPARLLNIDGAERLAYRLGRIGDSLADQIRSALAEARRPGRG